MKRLIPLLLLSACASTPERIAPVSGMKCPADAQARLASLSADQHRAVTTDRVSVFLIGVPVSRISGADKSKEIAKLKGCQQ